MDKDKLKNALKKLKEIIEWFDKQEDVDVEVGLEKVKEGVSLIKASKKRLGQIENEFEAVKKDLNKD